MHVYVRAYLCLDRPNGQMSYHSIKLFSGLISHLDTVCACRASYYNMYNHVFK